MIKKYLALLALLLLIPAIYVYATDGVSGVEHPAKVNSVVTPDKVCGVSGLAAAGGCDYTSWDFTDDFEDYINAWWDAGETETGTTTINQSAVQAHSSSNSVLCTYGAAWEAGYVSNADTPGVQLWFRFWIYPTTFPTSDGQVCILDLSPGFCLKLQADGKFLFDSTQGDDPAESTASVTLNQWNQVVGYYLQDDTNGAAWLKINSDEKTIDDSTLGDNKGAASNTVKFGIQTRGGGAGVFYLDDFSYDNDQEISYCAE